MQATKRTMIEGIIQNEKSRSQERLSMMLS
jgi:hypothetical protein